MPNVTPTDQVRRILDANFDIQEFVDKLEDDGDVSETTKEAARCLLQLENPNTLRGILASTAWKTMYIQKETHNLAHWLMHHAASETNERVLSLLQKQIGILSRRKEEDS